MFKRIFAIAVCFVMIFSFTACSNKIETEESVLIKESDNQLTETKLLKTVEFSKDGVTVILNEILYEDVVTKLYFDIKNDTEKPLMVLTTDLSINSLMCTDSIMEFVDAKSAKAAFLEISNEWFNNLNIRAIKDLEFVVRVLDENSNELMRSDLLSVLTDSPKKYVQQYDKNGFVVFENDEISLLSQTLQKSKLSDDSELDFYVENNTNSHFSLIATEVFVNEVPFEPTFIISVGSKKKAIDSMLFLEKDLKSAKIKEITSVSASFKAIDENLQTIFETELIQIPIK